MVEKAPSIRLMDYRNTWGKTDDKPFRVLSAKNSTRHLPGSYLDRSTVENLILEGWDVVLVEPKNGHS